jgi:predicted acetyltransferase
MWPVVLRVGHEDAVREAALLLGDVAERLGAEPAVQPRQLLSGLHPERAVDTLVRGNVAERGNGQPLVQTGHAQRGLIAQRILDALVPGDIAERTGREPVVQAREPPRRLIAQRILDALVPGDVTERLGGEPVVEQREPLRRFQPQRIVDALVPGDVPQRLRRRYPVIAAQLLGRSNPVFAVVFVHGDAGLFCEIVGQLVASASFDDVKIHLDLRPVKIHRKLSGERQIRGLWQTRRVPRDSPERPAAPPTEPVELRPVTRSDRAVLENLGQLYRHDLSEAYRHLPNADGTFNNRRLDLFLAGADPRVRAWLIIVAGALGGFVMTGPAPDGGMSIRDFFVVRALRRTGVGREAARQAIATTPGPWSIGFQTYNAGVQQFWTQVASDATAGTWTTHDDPPVEGRPPDTWITFET